MTKKTQRHLPQTSRNDQIIDLLQYGWSEGQVAAAYGLTRQRISQIALDRGLDLNKRVQQQKLQRQVAKLKKMTKKYQYQIHGTLQAYAYHLAHNTVPCDACRAANATRHRNQEHIRARNNKRKEQ